MTMRYTHIGIDDQAKALAALPNPCQHIVSISGDFGGQKAAQVDAARQGTATSKLTQPCARPYLLTLLDKKRHRMAPVPKGGGGGN
jgi:hypothetical protein